MFWLVFICCEYTPHVVCACGTLHPLDDCFTYDEGDFPHDDHPSLFIDNVLVHGDCEFVGVPELRRWPVPERWSCGEFVIRGSASHVPRQTYCQ